MTILAFLTIFLVISVGVILVMYAKEIGNRFFFELIPGFGITNFVEKYILRRKTKDAKEKPGMFMFVWLIRLFGCIWILFSFFMIYIIFFNKQ
jgi:hypothetical protein